MAEAKVTTWWDGETGTWTLWSDGELLVEDKEFEKVSLDAESVKKLYEALKELFEK